MKNILLTILGSILGIVLGIGIIVSYVFIREQNINNKEYLP